MHKQTEHPSLSPAAQQEREIISHHGQDPFVHLSVNERMQYVGMQVAVELSTNRILATEETCDQLASTMAHLGYEPEQWIAIDGPRATIQKKIGDVLL